MADGDLRDQIARIEVDIELPIEGCRKALSKVAIAAIRFEPATRLFWCSRNGLQDIDL